MKFNKYLFGFTLIIIALATFLALPQFSIGNFNFPNIDLAYLGVQSNLGDIKRSFGVSNQLITTAQINFPSEIVETDKESKAKSFLEIINKRINYSSLLDVNASLERKDNNYFIKFEMPEYYGTAKATRIADFLTAKGSITFSKQVQSSTIPVSLKDKDIEGSITTTFDQNYGLVLYFKFNPEKSSLLSSAFAQAQANTTEYFLMTIDSEQYYVIPFNNTFDSNSTNPTAVKAFPLSTGEDRSYQINIAKTYFLDKALDINATVNSSVTTEYAKFNTDGIRFIIFGFILSCLLICAFIFRLFGKRATLIVGINIGFFVSIYILLMKFLSSSTPLSVYTILGFGVALIIYVFFNIKLIQEKEDHLKVNIRNIRDLSILIIFAMLAINTFVPNVFDFNDFFGSILFGFTIIFLSTLNILQNNILYIFNRNRK